MALNTQTIGKVMPNGFAGNFARQPDSIINTRPAGGANPIPFGSPLKYSSGAVVLMGASSAATDFVGVAGAEIKTQTNYANPGGGTYLPGDAVPVIQRGSVNVICQNGTPALGGTVYVRILANTSLPEAVVGGFEAAADSSNSVALTNAQWAGPADANGVAELRILTQQLA